MEKVFLTEHIHPDAVAYLRENFEVVQGTSTESGEIIRQAQAQMRALGSLQWQDGYPAAADIGHDIACGYGWVFEKPEAEKSPEARGSDGTGAAVFRPETAAARKIPDCLVPMCWSIT